MCKALLLGLLLWAAVLPVRAEDDAPATLSLANRELMQFRASSLGLSPQARQRRAAEQLRQLLASGTEHIVTVQAGPEGLALLVDGGLAFWVLPGDVDGEGSDALQAAAEARAVVLRQALAERREATDLKGMAIDVALVLAALLLLLLPLLWLLGRAYRWALRHLAGVAARHATRLQLGGSSLLSSERLIDALRTLLRLLHALVWLLLVYEWLGWALRQFPYTRPWGERLQQVMLDALGQLANSAAAALPNLLVAVLIFVLARFLLSVLKPFFDRAESGAVDLGWLDADTARPTRRLIAMGVWLFALAMAYPYLPGAQTEAFKGLSVLIGLMVSLGASSIIGQGAAGLILMYTRTLRVGEFVRIGEHEGTVTELGAFATRIRTGLGEELTLPNSLITGTVTRNYSRALKGEGFVIDTTVTIGYDTPWRQVEAMLKLAASRTPGVLNDPLPRVFQTALSDFYVEYRLVAQARPTEPGPRAQVLNLLHGQIQDVFNEFGVQIMSPHYRGDPPDPKLVPPARWHEAPARSPAETSRIRPHE